MSLFLRRQANSLEQILRVIEDSISKLQRDQNKHATAAAHGCLDSSPGEFRALEQLIAQFTLTSQL